MKKLLVALLSLALSTAAYAVCDASVSLWGEATVSPTNVHSGTLASPGTKFTTNVSGIITSLIFWKNPNDTTTSRNLYLWSSGGTQLLSCTTINEATGTGQWITCPVSYPVAINTTLVVTYDVHGGYYVEEGSGTACSTALSAQGWLTCNAPLWSGGSNDTFPTGASSYDFLADVVFYPV